MAPRYLNAHSRQATQVLVHLGRGRILLVLALINVSVHCGASYGKPASDRPNIVFVLTDDQRFDVNGFSGHPIVETPHVDQFEAESTRREYFYEHHFVYPTIPQQEGIRTERWKDLRYETLEEDSEELFDLQSDPSELRNLARSPEYSEALAEMRGRWRALRAEAAGGTHLVN